MMSQSEIEQAATVIGDHISAGLLLQQAIARMPKFQKKYEKLWEQIAFSIAQGNTLSENLNGIWPKSFVTAIRSGEQSGKLEEVFSQIIDALDVNKKINKAFSKLIYPVTLIPVGFGVSIFIMVYPIPALFSSLVMDQDEFTGMTNFLFKLSEILSDLVLDKSPLFIGMILSFIFLCLYIIKNPNTKTFILNLSLKIPFVNRYVKHLVFAKWCYYVGLLSSTGDFDVDKIFIAPIEMLPSKLHEGVKRAASEVRAKGLGECIGSDSPDDPRSEWPFFVKQALLLADATGKIDESMFKISQVLLRTGLRGIYIVGETARYICMIVAGFVAALPMIIFYAQYGAILIKNLGRY